MDGQKCCWLVCCLVGGLSLSVHATVVNCAACMAVEMQTVSWQCEVNCEVAGNNNASLIEQLMFDLKQLKSDFKQLKENHTTEIQQLKENHTAEIQQLKGSETGNSLQEISDLQTSLAELEQDNSQILDDISLLKESFDVFHGYAISGTIQNNVIFKFNDVTFDRLGSYDTSNGKFTAVKAGKYQVLLVCRSTGTAAANLDIYVTRPPSTWDIAVAKASADFRVGVASHLLTLNPGDKIFVKGESNGQAQTKSTFLQISRICRT